MSIGDEFRYVHNGFEKDNNMYLAGSYHLYLLNFETGNLSIDKAKGVQNCYKWLYLKISVKL